MSGSQMLLIIGAIMLLSFITVNVNRSILNSTEQTIEAECIIAANAVAKSAINEISSKSFDESTVSVVLDESNIPGSFTSYQSLGPEGEVYPAYDDVDDFDGYSTTVSTPRTGDFTANVSVGYVNVGTPDVIVTTKTRTKRIEVTVTNPTLVDTLRLYYYSSY